MLISWLAAGRGPIPFSVPKQACNGAPVAQETMQLPKGSHSRRGEGTH